MTTHFDFQPLTNTLFADTEERWAAERAAATERFRSHANLILAAPPGEREGLLVEYGLAARERFGNPTAWHMVVTMRGFVQRKASRGE